MWIRVSMNRDCSRGPERAAGGIRISDAGLARPALRCFRESRAYALSRSGSVSVDRRAGQPARRPCCAGPGVLVYWERVRIGSNPGDGRQPEIEMAVTLSKTYAALREAGASEEAAREASEEIAGFESRMVRLEAKMNVVLAGVSLLVIHLLVQAARSVFQTN